MPQFYPAMGLASPKQQAEQRGELGKFYRTIMRKFAQDIGPALDFPGNPLGPMMKILPILGAGIKSVRSLARPGYVAGIRKHLAKTFGEGKKGLPKFRSTEDAMVFGADHAGDQRTADLLRAAIKETTEEFKQLSRGSQGRAEKAFEGQFYRETLETVEGKVKPEWLERFGYKGYKPTPMPREIGKTTAVMRKVEPGLYKQHIPTISEKAAGTKSIDALLREFHELGK